MVLGSQPPCDYLSLVQRAGRRPVTRLDYSCKLPCHEPAQDVAGVPSSRSRAEPRRRRARVVVIVLEVLARWAPVAQFVGPLVALLAAYFAMKSAQASRKAAESTERANDHADRERAQKFRPRLDVDVVSEGSSGGAFRGRLVVISRDSDNIAHIESLEVSPAKNERYRSVNCHPTALGPGKKAQSGLLIYPALQKEYTGEIGLDGIEGRLLRGRIYYSDELGIAHWSQHFSVQELAHEHDEQVTYHFSIPGMTAPKREKGPPEIDEYNA